MTIERIRDGALLHTSRTRNIFFSFNYFRISCRKLVDIFLAMSVVFSYQVYKDDS